MREALIERATHETSVRVRINLDGPGGGSIQTGVGFLDHMLNLFAFWSGFSLEISCQGDLHIDAHHSVEDVGITLGQAIKAALGDKAGIARFAQVSFPMDESLAHCALDISGRPFLVFNAALPSPRVGDFDTELTEEFFRALAVHSGVTLHINLAYGKNTHHIIEAIYKAAAFAFKQAAAVVGTGVPSTKGVL